MSAKIGILSVSQEVRPAFSKYLPIEILYQQTITGQTSFRSLLSVPIFLPFIKASPSTAGNDPNSMNRLTWVNSSLNIISMYRILAIYTFYFRPDFRGRSKTKCCPMAMKIETEGKGNSNGNQHRIKKRGFLG